jgi:tricorn protease-like protein
MKKIILAVLAVPFLGNTSAIASDFCEVPKWIKEEKSYMMLLGTGGQAFGKVVDIDKKSCWIIVEDRSRVIKMDLEGPGDFVNVNIRQIVSAIEQQ